MRNPIAKGTWNRTDCTVRPIRLLMKAIQQGKITPACDIVAEEVFVLSEQQIDFFCRQRTFEDNEIVYPQIGVWQRAVTDGQIS